jgi:hypothetical protein
MAPGQKMVEGRASFQAFSPQKRPTLRYLPYPYISANALTPGPAPRSRVPWGKEGPSSWVAMITISAPHCVAFLALAMGHTGVECGGGPEGPEKVPGGGAARPLEGTFREVFATPKPFHGSFPTPSRLGPSPPGRRGS